MFFSKLASQGRLNIFVRGLTVLAPRQPLDQRCASPSFLVSEKTSTNYKNSNQAGSIQALLIADGLRNS